MAFYILPRENGPTTYGEGDIVPEGAKVVSEETYIAALQKAREASIRAATERPNVSETAQEPTAA